MQDDSTGAISAPGGAPARGRGRPWSAAGRDSRPRSERPRSRACPTVPRSDQGCEPRQRLRAGARSLGHQGQCRRPAGGVAGPRCSTLAQQLGRHQDAAALPATFSNWSATSSIRPRPASSPSSARTSSASRSSCRNSARPMLPPASSASRAARFSSMSGASCRRPSTTSLARQRAKAQAGAARGDRRRQHAGMLGDDDQHHPGRRLLQQLQQRVGRAFAEIDRRDRAAGCGSRPWRRSCKPPPSAA